MLLKIDYDGVTRVRRAEDGDMSEPNWKLVCTMGKVTFLVEGLDLDDALAETQAAAQAAQRLAAKLKEELQEATAEAAKLKTDHEQARLTLAHERQLRRDDAKNNEAWRQKARNLEADIAKLRTALGELRMKEILGS